MWETFSIWYTLLIRNDPRLLLTCLFYEDFILGYRLVLMADDALFRKDESDFIVDSGDSHLPSSIVSACRTMRYLERIK